MVAKPFYLFITFAVLCVDLSFMLALLFILYEQFV